MLEMSELLQIQRYWQNGRDNEEYLFIENVDEWLRVRFKWLHLSTHSRYQGIENVTTRHNVIVTMLFNEALTINRLFQTTF